MTLGRQFRALDAGVAAGRFLLRSDPLAATDPMTQLVRHFKVDRSRDHEVAGLLVAAHRGAGLPRPDLVVSPPPSPGNQDRFTDVRAGVASALGAHAAAPMRELGDVAGYRRMNIAQRQHASRAFGETGRYSADPDVVRGRHVLVVDDVVTSGEHARHMDRALRTAGAAHVSFVAAAQARGLR